MLLLLVLIVLQHQVMMEVTTQTLLETPMQQARIAILKITITAKEVLV